MSWLHFLREQMFAIPTLWRARKHTPYARKPYQRLHVEQLEDRLVLSANMVVDLDAYTLNSNPQNITTAANTTFFTATPGNGLTSLYKTDGTAAGTMQLMSGSQLFNPSHLVAFNNKLFFTAFDSGKGITDLWTSDGTVAGTTPFLAGGSNVQTAFTDATSETVIGNKLYFQAVDPSSGLNVLWVSNGTSAGTHPVQPGSTTTPTQITEFTNVNGKLFFINHNSSTGSYELWSSNGTAAGTSMVIYLSSSYAPTNLTAVGSTLYFEMYDPTNSLYALWKSNGTGSGTTMMGDVGTTKTAFASLTALGSSLFFDVYDTTDAPNTGWALWTTSGTTLTPFRYGGSTPVQVYGNSQIIVFNNDLYFDGYDLTNGYSLWQSDGASSNNNTAPLLGTTTNPSQLTINGSQLYFVAENAAEDHRYGLWRTNGTAAGTAPIQTSGFAQGISNLTASGSKMFFQAADEDARGNSPHGYELWVSDGTNAGTAMVTDLNTNTYSSNPTGPNSTSGPLLAVGTEVFFNAGTYVPVTGGFLWQSDGTVGGTAPVQTSTGVVPVAEQNATAVGNTVFFTGYAGNGNDLWTTGTGTKSAVELFAGATNPFKGNFASTDGTAFASSGGLLYFGAYDAANSQNALWQSNGTAAGTTVVADLGSAVVSSLTVVGNNLFWQSYDSANSTYALWEYNSPTGTASLVSDISPAGFTNLTAVGSSAFFQSYDGATGKYALWTSNGTTTTNVAEFDGSPLVSLTSFNGLLYFGAHNSAGYYQMWSSDGTSANTAPLLTDNGLPVLVSSTPDFTVMGSKLFYVNGNSQLGETDGTASGTGDVQAGAPPGAVLARLPSNMVVDNGILVFSAYDSAHGYELWQSDGTAAGTLIADDIVSGSGSSSPENLAVAANQVFFNATDTAHGSELWTASIGQNVVTASLSGPTDGVTEQHRPFVLTASDSYSANNSAGFSFAINWGDGSSQTIIGQSGLSADHQYATAGTYTIQVTATNLADNVTSAAVSQNEAITQTEVQGVNLALGGVAGNNAWVITRGTTAGTFTITDNSATVLNNYKPAAGMQIFLYSGNGTNTISINDSGTTNDSFTLGTGYVTFAGATFLPQNPVDWTINGNNANDTFTIKGALTANINGGSGNDTFKMVTGANLTGSINGGGGTNTLDYTTYTTGGIIVDLPLGSATAISGGISGIENVTGSGKGGDILVGDGNANVLKSLKGHNILIGGSGGGDSLTSGGTGDILIAGTTSYDTNLTALLYILNEWKKVTASTYASVINTIENSATDPLNASTVTDAGSPDLADTLNGKAGKTAVADWYFAHTAGGANPNDTINSQFSGETVTAI